MTRTEENPRVLRPLSNRRADSEHSALSPLFLYGALATGFSSTPSPAISTRTVSPGRSQRGGLRVNPTPRGSAGGNHVTRLQRHDLRQVLYRLGNLKDELASVRSL